LMGAVWAGKMEPVEELLALGAKPGLHDKRGKSAIEQAAEGGHEAILARLKRGK